MTEDRWSQIQGLFLQAVELTPESRPDFLDQACGTDAELRREIESLIDCDAPNQQLIAVPQLDDQDSDEDDSNSGMSGRRIGPYRVVRQLGYGGMGAVYLGVRDDDQYSKQVAIKLLKRGMDTDFMLSRFRQERQILANLEHPFIARMLDGGATEDGRPYFVMEYVDGVPITEYCQRNGLSITERLHLFRLVCEAVQHAHQNLVVHRDIKPGNILATKEGIPKLLDFGIAKVVDTAATGMTLTQRELRLLTPQYASPEQVRGAPIGTASDIYSLGVVLYELLAGCRPYSVPTEALADLEKAICEAEPARPSAAAASNPDSTPGERKQLRRRLAGDLDNIVMAALRKEPQRRYASAAELSEDLRRHVEGFPIVAQGTRWRDAAWKFIRRNRLGVAAAALVVASLIGGIIATSFQARRAERRFELARGLANSMLFELHDEMERLPGSTALRASTVRTVVKYLDRLAQDGSHNPGLDLEIALAYERAGGLEGHPFKSNLGRGQAAVENYEKAIALYQRMIDEPAFRTRAIRGLIDTHLLVGKVQYLLGDVPASSAHFDKAGAIAAEAFADGKSDIPRTTQVNMYFRLADAEYLRGSAQGELAHYRKALEMCQQWTAAERSSAATSSLRDSYQQVGNALGRMGDLVAARDSYRRALDVSESLLQHDIQPELKYRNISLHTAIGDILGAPDDPNFGDPAGALAAYHTALALASEWVEADPQNANARRNVAASYWRLGMSLVSTNPQDALAFCKKAQALSEALNSGDPANLEYQYHLSRAHLGAGEALHNLGRDEEASQSLMRAIALQNSIHAVSPDRIWHLRVLSRAYFLLGDVRRSLGDWARAAEALQNGLAAADGMLARAPASLYHQLDRADALEAMGRHYASLAQRPSVDAVRRREWKQQARVCVERSLAIWQDWTKRKIGAPYASRRESRAAALIASLR